MREGQKAEEGGRDRGEGEGEGEGEGGGEREEDTSTGDEALEPGPVWELAADTEIKKWISFHTNITHAKYIS